MEAAVVVREEGREEVTGGWHRFDDIFVRLKKLRRVFKALDLNGDGKVNKREFIRALRSNKEVQDFMQMPAVKQEDGSRDSFESIFQAIDCDGDREISWVEFLNYFAKADSSEAGHSTWLQIALKAQGNQSASSHHLTPL